MASFDPSASTAALAAAGGKAEPAVEGRAESARTGEGIEIESSVRDSGAGGGAGAGAGKGGGGNFVRYNTKGGKGNHSFGYESKYVVHI
jgi:hypothetical protein